MAQRAADPRLLVGLLVAASLGCAGESTRNPAAPQPSPAAPNPTPVPAGSIRFVAASLPDGSTVKVAPMAMFGQQAQELRFWAGVTVRQEIAQGVVQAFVRTSQHRCMGGGHVRGFPAGEEVLAAPLSMSHQADPLPPCALPYTTTEVEFVVLDSTGAIVLQTRFPGVYHFVPE